MTVAVVGAINVDLAVAADRLPGPGQTVLGDRLRRFGGGKGANAAVAAARAGASVRLIGAVGDDPDGAGQLAELATAGVDVTDIATLPGVPTGVALIVTDPAGENQIAVAAGANAELGPELVRAALDRRPPRLVLVSAEVGLPAIAAAVRWCAQARTTCLLNPAPARPELLPLLDLGPILTPNAGELAALGEGSPASLAARSGAPVVVTRGADGALIVRPDGTEHPVPATVVEVRDGTGAGDVFNGVLAAELAGGAELASAVRTAVTAASISVGRQGAR